ncbi:hypothetical protein LOZ58_003355 [Ophidiomyces ophidiicola]|nr:hypothetical protein LOZ58_003355 [Ophidiomyces ophidiicola]
MLRVSTRIRKPSQRAKEAGYTGAPHSQVAALEKSAKLKMALKPRAPTGKGKGKQRAGGLAANGDDIKMPVLTVNEEDERAVCLLLELVSAALAPDFKPEVEIDLDALRRAFNASLQN